MATNSRIEASSEIRSTLVKPSANHRISATAALADRFRLSLPTIRQALAVLRAEGLVESRHGVGTFVKEDRRLQRRSRSRYGRARGDEQLLTSALRHHVAFAGRTAVPAHIAGILGVDPQTEVVIRRRYLYNVESGKPEEMGASYLPVDIAGGTYLEEPAVVPQALFLCIEELSGKRYARAHDQWLARMPTAEEAAVLELPTGAPVLHVVHTARAEDGVILEVSESVWPADRVLVVDEYDIEQEADEPSAASEV